MMMNKDRPGQNLSPYDIPQLREVVKRLRPQGGGDGPRWRGLW